MASSTTIPIATASPPRVIEFTLIPKRVKIMTVTAKDKGIAVSVINVVVIEDRGLLRLKRKINSTMITMIAPSRMASNKLCMAASMKLACLNSGVRMMSLCSSSSLILISAMVCSICFVRVRVSTPGDFTILRTTPGLPFTPASPR